MNSLLSGPWTVHMQFISSPTLPSLCPNSPKISSLGPTNKTGQSALMRLLMQHHPGTQAQNKSVELRDADLARVYPTEATESSPTLPRAASSSCSNQSLSSENVFVFGKSQGLSLVWLFGGSIPSSQLPICPGFCFPLPARRLSRGAIFQVCCASVPPDSPPVHVSCDTDREPPFLVAVADKNVEMKPGAISPIKLSNGQDH